VEQSTSSEANSQSARRQISHILCNNIFHRPIHIGPLHVPLLCEINVMHFPRPLYYVCDVLNIYGGKCLGPRPNLQAEGPPFIGCPVECTSSYSAHLKTFFSIPSTWPRPAGITGTHLPRSCFHYHRLAQFSKCWHILKQLTLSNLKRVFVEYTQPRVCVCVCVCGNTVTTHLHVLSTSSFSSSLSFIILYTFFISYLLLLQPHFYSFI